MFNRLIVLTLFILGSAVTFAQDCSIGISGRVTDEGTAEPLSYVNILVQELGQGGITDDDGNFDIPNLCPGHYHLIISHIGCEPIEMHLDLEQDTVLNVVLEHSAIFLNGVVVEEKHSPLTNQPSQSISNQVIQDNTDETLSGLLENEVGVHILKSGGGIGKPVVHGLFGNRLTILNNGIPQSGQQWGNDHSPEIDPLIANQILIIKGTNALEYAGGSLGSILMVEPKKIGREPHLHGHVNYAYDTNGKGNSVNMELQKYSDLLAWRINGTFKKFGDRKTSDYYLNNTGSEEMNFALQLEKSWNDKMFLDIYASTFNTELGILRGSHVGNLTDLDQAFSREVPFFTEDAFDYTIEAPKQTVGHHLLKLKSQYYFSDEESIQLIVSGQLNNRKEFDIRRGGRSDIPSLSLEQFSFTSDIKYQKALKNNWQINIGNQNIITDNTNSPETGILPLIPDYFSFKAGLYTTLNKDWTRTKLNFGLRYDYENQNVVAINKEAVSKIVRYENNYSNVSGTIGFSHQFSDRQSVTFNTGYAMRNPAVNELYSNGLHQGVSGIEEGDVNLQTEKAIKTTIEYKEQIGANFSFASLLYYQRFQDYIFLDPQDDVRLTIRGAFPVFQYGQADAEIYGFDLSTVASFSNSFIGELKFSFIKGNNLGMNIPLVNVPPVSLFGNITYRVNKPITLAKMKVEDVELEINNRYVFQQQNLLPEQDFVLTPDAYNLIGLKFSSNVILPSYKFRIYAKIDNLLNEKYRDYLNRQRYFADDLGRSITFGLNFKF